MAIIRESVERCYGKTRPPSGRGAWRRLSKCQAGLALPAATRAGYHGALQDEAIAIALTDPHNGGQKRKEALLPVQSSPSAFMACRALAMISCLVALPIVAMFGTSWLDGAASLLERVWVSSATAARESAPESGTGPLKVAVANAGGTGGPFQPSRWTAHPDSTGAAVDGPWPDVPPEGVSGLSGSSEPLAAMEQRLRQMGATSYRLETWGQGVRRFRFQCRVAADPTTGWARHFEATDPQPVQAVAKVLASVECWLQARKATR